MRVHLILLVFVFSCQNNDVYFTQDDPVEALLKEFVSNSDSAGAQLNLSFSDSTIYEVEATYIGILKLNSGDTLKTLNVIHYTGLFRDAVRARGEIVFFNGANIILGKYNVGGKDLLPSHIQKKAQLVFIPEGDCNLKTAIDCSEGPPEILFIECTEKGGDLYNFSPSVSNR